MAVGADASGDDLNNFHPVINASGELVRWFKAEYGSTRCAGILQTNFSSAARVSRYLAENGIDRCRQIAQSVAGRVLELWD
jgi:hypothetical protein